MRITLVGSRHFGVTTFNTLRQHGVAIARVVVHDGEDRLAATARTAGIEVVVQADPKRVVASEIAPNTDLIVTAHSHARVTREALAALPGREPVRSASGIQDGPRIAWRSAILGRLKENGWSKFWSAAIHRRF